jgi:uncharacterized protein
MQHRIRLPVPANFPDMPNTFINTLSDSAVRDLAWVIGSPGLLEASCPAYQGQVVDDAWCSAQLQQYASRLVALDRSPAALHHFIAARPTRRLGHYFEALISYWLMHMSNTRLIATNLQVQHEQRTLGEYDFLFSDEDAAICHWEAAVKFYLQLEPMPEQRAFIGPGTRDRLDIKLDKVFKHQLLLGQTSAGKNALPAGIKLNKTQAFIKGYLFYHASTLRNVITEGVSAGHLAGWWIRHTREQLPRTSPDSRWLILPRMRWLAPARVAHEADTMTDAALAHWLHEHFSLSTEAILVFEMIQSKSGDWHEIARGFIVCSTWPILDAPL